MPRLAKRLRRAGGTTTTPRPASSRTFRTGRTPGNQDNLVDDSKEAAVAELGGALTAMGMEGKSFGELTLSVVIYDEDRNKGRAHRRRIPENYSRSMTGCCMRNATTCSMPSSPRSQAIGSSISANSGHSTPTMPTCPSSLRSTQDRRGTRNWIRSISRSLNRYTARRTT